MSNFGAKFPIGTKGYEGRVWQGRKEGHYRWFELQDAVDYFGEFEKAKLVIPAISQTAAFAFDDQGYYSNDKTTIVASTDFALLAVLTSKLLDFWIKSIASTKQGGFFEYKPMYITQMPVKLDAGSSLAKSLRDLVQEIMAAKALSPTDDISVLEAEIDRLMYGLYGLTEEEIAIVEGG